MRERIPMGGGGGLVVAALIVAGVVWFAGNALKSSHPAAKQVAASVVASTPATADPFPGRHACDSLMKADVRQYGQLYRVRWYEHDTYHREMRTWDTLTRFYTWDATESGCDVSTEIG